MRKYIVVIAILTLLVAACTKQQKPTRARVTPVPLTTLATTSSVPYSPIAPASTRPILTTTAGIKPALPVCCPGTGSATDVANEFVTALIQGQAPSDLPDVDLWLQVVAGGSIVQATPISEAAGRATVAVSVAFNGSSEAAITDPIGLRIQLAEVDVCWHVESMGYL